MSKLDIHDIAGLTRYAIAEGIIEINVRLTIIYTACLPCPKKQRVFFFDN